MPQTSIKSTPAKVLHKGEFLQLERRDHWEYVRRTKSSGGAAFLIAVTAEQELVLVEQYRLPVQKRVIELPAGIIGDEHPDETVVAAALRELEEETGFRAESAKIIFDAPTAAGLSCEWAYFVQMHKLKRIHAGGGVDDEDIKTHLVPLANLQNFIREQQKNGLAVDARVYTAVQLLSYQS